MTTLDAIFDKAVKLPTISQVVYDLVDMTRREDVELSEIVAKIREDQAIAARVIRIANSSFYMETGRVSTVDRAVKIVGIQTLRSTVITSGVIGTFPKVPGVEMANYWRHVLTSAVIAIEMARHLNVDEEEAFTAALMQGLGILLLHLSLPREAEAIASTIDPLDFEGRLKVEAQLLGFGHNEVAAELLQRWRFPEAICTAILFYSKPHDGDLLCKIVFASAHYAWGKISGLSEHAIAVSLEVKLPGALGLNGEWFASRKALVSTWVSSILQSS